MRPAAPSGALGLLLLAGTALAKPPYATWDSVLPGSVDACQSCHFDHDAVRDSALIRVDGLPPVVAPGAVHEVVLTLNAEGARTGAFLARFDSGRVIGAAAGLEVRGAAVRAIEPLAMPARWSFRWQAPVAPGAIALMVAANAANDDASPFGDMTHYARREIVVALPRSR